MIRDIQEETVRYIYRVKSAERPEERENLTENKYEDEKTNKPIKVEKIGRNDDCPCGSGKKYKKCCGRTV